MAGELIMINEGQSFYIIVCIEFFTLEMVILNVNILNSIYRKVSFQYWVFFSISGAAQLSSFIVPFCNLPTGNNTFGFTCHTNPINFIEILNYCGHD